jgi:hypothetical protein
MANTFELIASSTVGAGGASSIDFTSIPSTFTDLCVKVSVRCSQSQIYGEFQIAFNNTGTSFSTRLLEGNGGSVASYTSFRRIGVATGANATASTFGNAEIYIPNYSGSTIKSFTADGVSENNGTSAWTDLVAGLWSNTAAINQVTVSPETGTFLQYSTAYLYGVKNA